jgi:hypothetical protein
MLSSPLDGVLYHPFMIASTSTFENFRKWYMDGAPFHHEAVLASDPPLNSDYIGDCVKYTVELLEFAFGDRLANELKDWRFALDCGAYAIDGCGGHHCGSHIRQEAA